MLIVIFSIAFFSFHCSKDEKKCTNFALNGQSVTVNGSSLSTSICQLIISNAGDEDSYYMAISYISDDCNKMTTMSLSFDLPAGQKLNGTYPLKDFFNSNLGEGYGSVTEQVINPVSQNIVDIASGSAKIIDKGSKKYNVDITANLIGGTTVTIRGDLQF